MHRHHIVRRAAWLVSALLLAASAFAEAPLVAAGSFAVQMVAQGAAPDGTITSRFHEGEVRVDVVSEDEGFTVLFVIRDGAYVLQAFEPGRAGVQLEATLAELLADDDYYAEFADLFLLMLHPESPAHPCVHTPPADGVLTGDFGVWDCESIGTEMLGGRSTTVWELEFIWGREGRMAVFNDPKHTVWIDDELGVPIAFEDGFGDFTATFGAIDHATQDAALFGLPD